MVRRDVGPRLGLRRPYPRWSRILRRSGPQSGGDPPSECPVVWRVRRRCVGRAAPFCCRPDIVTHRTIFRCEHLHGLRVPSGRPRVMRSKRQNN